MIEQWLASHYFERSGLEPQPIRSRVINECRDGGDFLRVVMESIAESQNVDRWAETTPAHLLYIPEIKKAFPDALILHVIRDGRDCALSLERQRWIAPLPFDRQNRLLAAALYWKWIVRRGRAYGQKIAPDYMEVRFENLLSDTSGELARIGSFINHDLDYDRIQQSQIGSVGLPNTSFAETGSRREFNPVGRWRERFPKAELALFELAAGSLLGELGYKLSSSDHSLSQRMDARSLSALYRLYFDARHWIKSYTPLSRFMVSTALLRRGPNHNERSTISS